MDLTLEDFNPEVSDGKVGTYQYSIAGVTKPKEKKTDESGKTTVQASAQKPVAPLTDSDKTTDNQYVLTINFVGDLQYAGKVTVNYQPIKGERTIEVVEANESPKKLIAAKDSEVKVSVAKNGTHSFNIIKYDGWFGVGEHKKIYDTIMTKDRTLTIQWVR